MKIRDTSGYVLQLTDGKHIEQLGTNKDYLFRFLEGAKKNILTYIGDLTSFAGEAGIQLFYEYLQNADDANASTIRIFYDESNLLIINNGTPFYTDKSNRKGQLESILGKGGSDKNENEGNIEKGSIGKHGQGAKLIFSFLTDDFGDKKTEQTLVKAIIKELKGPIIYSWKEWSAIEALRNSDAAKIELKHYEDEDYPLLTKLIYSYYPSYPNEKKVLIDGQLTNLFPKSDYTQFRNYVDKVLKNKSLVEFHQGAMFYIPLGENQTQNIEYYIDRLHNEISISLNFLKSVKKVTINETVIHKSDFTTNSWEDEDGKSFQICYPDLLNTEVNIQSNFYQYFPVTREKHGFHFLINSKFFEIDNGRQNIDISKTYNKNISQAIAKSIGNNLVQLKSSRLEFLPLFNALLNSKQPETAFYKDFYNGLIIAIKQNIPVEGGQYETKAENVIICNTALNIKPSDLGIPDLQIIDKRLLNSSKQLTSVLGVKEWNLLNLVIKANNNPVFITWLKSLTNTDYSKFINEINEHKNSIHQIESLKIFKGNDDDIYNLKDIKKYSNVFFFTNSIQSINLILEEQESIIVGENLSNVSFVETLNAYYERDKKSLLEKITDKIDANKLNHHQKWSLVNNFQQYFEPFIEDVKFKFPIFKKTNGDYHSLGSLLYNSNELAVSGLLANFQIEPAEYNKTFKSLFLDKDNVWNELIKSWKTLIQPIFDTNVNAENYNLYYDDLIKIGSESNADLSEFNFIKTISSELVTSAAIFYNPQLLKITSDEYNATIRLLQKLTDFEVVNQTDLKILANNDLFGLEESGLTAIKKQLRKNESTLSLEELKLLNNLKNGNWLFIHFYINKIAENQYLLSERTNETQYFYQDKMLNGFLAKGTKYHLLPKELKKIFSSDGLLIDADGLANKLLTDFGSEKAFINLIVDRNKDTKKEYAKNIYLELSIEEEYDKDSFESIFLSKFIIKEGWEDAFKYKIEINGKALNHFTYSDRVSIKTDDGNYAKFSLAELLPQYKGISNVLDIIKKSFIDEHSIRRSSLFQAKNKDLIEVKSELLHLGISTPLQIAFAVCYQLSEKGSNDKFIIPKLTDNSKYQELLDVFHENSVSNYPEKYQIDSFIPTQCIFTDEITYLFPNEYLPNWVNNWLKNTNESKENRTKKIDFLYNIGVENKGVYYIGIRKSLEKDERFEHTKLVSYNTFFTKNTLDWTIQKLGSPLVGNSNRFKIIRDLIPYHLEHNANEFPSHLLKITEVNEKTIHYSIAPFQSLKGSGLYIESSTDKDELKLIFEGANKYKKQLITFNSLFNDELIKRIGLSKVSLEREFDANSVTNLNEWTAIYYQEWIKEKGIKFRIFIATSKLPFKNFIAFDNEKIEISISPNGLIERNDITNQTEKIARIYLYQGGFDKQLSILNILEKHQKNLFKSSEEKEQFIKLLGLATPSETEHDLLETLKSKGITSVNELRVLLKTSTNQQAGNVPIPFSNFYEKRQPSEIELNFIDNHYEKIITAAKNGQIGRYDFDMDLSEEQLKALNPALSDLLNLLEILSSDDIKYLLKEGYLKRLKETIDEESRAKPMYHVGYIGERLIYLYLKNIRSSNVEHTAIPPKETPAYDLLLQENGNEFFIDVKSTIQSIWGNDNSIPFYVKYSQYKYILKNLDANYFIVRLSLKDLNLETFARGYKNKIDVDNKDLCKRIDKYLLSKLNDISWRETFLKQIISFQVEAPNKIIDLFGKIR
jgi:hypothetical protein